MLILNPAVKEGRDGYDVVECIAAQSWCNGAVAFAGNSWLAASQWYVVF
jgi:predicted acyl esterase